MQHVPSAQWPDAARLARRLFRGHLTKDENGSWLIGGNGPPEGVFADDGNGSLIISETGPAAGRLASSTSADTGFTLYR